MNPEIVSRFLSLFTAESPEGLFSDKELQYIYNCISHKEETESGLRDQWGNWEFPYTEMDYRIPYLDDFILSRMKEKGVVRKQLWPDGKKFAFCITHDVDVISSNSATIKKRRYAKHLKNANGVFDKLRFSQMFYRNQLKSYFKKWEEEDTGYFDFFVETEKQFGYHSLFNIFIHSEESMHQYDCDYLPGDLCSHNNRLMPLGEILQSLAAEGFEIGLHGSYLSHTDSKLLKSQKEKLEQLTGQLVQSGRQHYLHFDMKQTPDVLSNSGIRIDTSLGFNRSIGFRAGTAMPYFLNNELLEIPMHIMDCSLFRNDSMNLGLDGAKIFISRYFDWVEASGGCLCINYHSDAFRYNDYRESYLFCLNEAKRRNACNILPSAIYHQVNNAILNH